MQSHKYKHRFPTTITLGVRIMPFLLAVFLLTACQDEMTSQPRYDPLQASELFPDQRSARPILPDTVPAGVLEAGQEFYIGRDQQGELLAELPVEVDELLLQRGRERYEIFCLPCHGEAGEGDGIIVVEYGFSPPPSLHEDRLRQAPDGHYFAVITNGFGEMYPYAYQVKPADRWAIIAYIRFLQGDIYE
jgi:mono/diheme cytochrome c family protein